MPAAIFAATYSDWRLIRGRKVVQIVFEVPIEKADQAYQTLGGMPDSAAEKWFAVAALKHEGEAPVPSTPAASDPTRASASPRGGPSPNKRLVTQAAIACNDIRFQRFLFEHDMIKELSSIEATKAVRLICGVSTRAAILPNTPAALKWDELHGKYLIWLKAA